MDVRIFGRAPAGGVVPIVVRTRKKTPNTRDMPLHAVTGLKVNITSTTGTAVVTDGTFAYIADGVYVYNWNTAGLATGNYSVVVTVTSSLADSNGSTAKGQIRLL